ncbi:MAG TPA: hypothetical protein VG672_18290 [Bryobacteraceae bacterium]|nr:hypothetical protein [Bryobacteraceae bacterium]
MLIENPRGNYSFIKGISPYSGGVVASYGYEIEYARLVPALPLKRGFEVVERHLQTLGRPRQALCGMALRIPEALSFQGFGEFNATYIKVLEGWGILQNGLNPVARTNVAPKVHPYPEPVLHAFSYTLPSRHAGKTFVVAGAGELPEGSLDPKDVVRRGETGQDALREKMRFVMGLMEGRLHDLGAGWPQVTTSDVYTVHDICPLLEKEVLERMGTASRLGIEWHYARPPIVSIEYEMDLRGVRRELVLSE